VKVNGLAPVFGARTLGAGGTVQTAAVLPNAAAELTLTRGVGSAVDPGEYPEALVIEDQGVSPDVAYAHTLADFRAGYVSAFSEVLCKELPQRGE